MDSIGFEQLLKKLLIDKEKESIILLNTCFTLLNFNSSYSFLLFLINVSNFKINY